MDRPRLLVLLPLMAALGACSETLTLPAIDASSDGALPDVAAPDAETPDVPLPTDAPPPLDTNPITDVPVAMDVPVMPDVPVTVDVPVVEDVPVTPDVPPPPDVTALCANGVTDACPAPGAGTPCADLNDGAPHAVVFAGLRTGLPASCEGTATGAGPDGVAPLTLTRPSSDVVVTISPAGTGTGVISLFRPNGCGVPAQEVACANTSSGAGGNTLRVTGLPPGTYWLQVSTNTAMTAVVQATVTAATVRPPVDACPGVTLTEGTAATTPVSALSSGTGPLTCPMGNTGDGAFTFTAPAAGNDVIVNVSASNGSVGFVLQRPCGGATLGGCTTGTSGPIWQRYSGLMPGAPHAVVAGSNAPSGTLSVQYRTVPTPTINAVAGNNTCVSAETLSPAGGIYRGSTSGSSIRTSAMSTGSLNPGCAPAQCLNAKTVFYRLTLGERRRVVVTMSPTGGGFDTLLFIRSGSMCPGNPIMNACNDDRIGTNAQIDVVLDPGTYWVMASGCGPTQEGDYALDVVTLPPA